MSSVDFSNTYISLTFARNRNCLIFAIAATLQRVDKSKFRSTMCCVDLFMSCWKSINDHRPVETNGKFALFTFPLSVRLCRCECESFVMTNKLCDSHKFNSTNSRFKSTTPMFSRKKSTFSCEQSYFDKSVLMFLSIEFSRDSRNFPSDLNIFVFFSQQCCSCHFMFSTRFDWLVKFRFWRFLEWTIKGISCNYCHCFHSIHHKKIEIWIHWQLCVIYFVAFHAGYQTETGTWTT